MPEDVTDHSESLDARLVGDVLRALHGLGGVTTRRLGRHRGLFYPATGDVPFGVVSGGGVFFRAGPEVVTKYIARAMRPFRTSDPRQPLRGFWAVPRDVTEDGKLLALWATWAVDAARRYGRRRPAKPKRRRPDQRRAAAVPNTVAAASDHSEASAKARCREGSREERLKNCS